MSDTQTTFTYTDPRYVPGDPFEVATAAFQQAKAAVELSVRALDDATVMARNAELERQLYEADECDATAWEASAQNKRLRAVRDDLITTASRLGALAVAAGYNPKKPPKG